MSVQQIQASYHWWGAMCEANRLGIAVYCIKSRRLIRWEE